MVQKIEGYELGTPCRDGFENPRDMQSLLCLMNFEDHRMISRIEIVCRRDLDSDPGTGSSKYGFNDHNNKWGNI